ncbi:MAG: GspH/FimT family pseudopilin [Deltaproteobacteria bacterium]|nr:GspH/FimT family pseudopilin [Deltaproteobacteria bacterium]
MRKRSGFTLIELVVVIAVLGILTAVGVPNFLSWLPKYRLKSAARDLYSNMQLAKMTAIKSNQNCTVTYSTDPDQYVLSGGLSKTVVLEDYGSGVNFDGPGNETFAVTTITFNSRGTSNAGYAYLSNSGNTAYYKVGPLSSGVIKLQKWVGGTSWE